MVTRAKGLIIRAFQSSFVYSRILNVTRQIFKRNPKTWGWESRKTVNTNSIGLVREGSPFSTYNVLYSSNVVDYT